MAFIMDSEYNILYSCLAGTQVLIFIPIELYYTSKLWHHRHHTVLVKRYVNILFHQIASMILLQLTLCFKYSMLMVDANYEMVYWSAFFISTVLVNCLLWTSLWRYWHLYYDMVWLSACFTQRWHSILTYQIHSNTLTESPYLAATDYNCNHNHTSPKTSLQLQSGVVKNDSKNKNKNKKTKKTKKRMSISDIVGSKRKDHTRGTSEFDANSSVFGGCDNGNGNVNGDGENGNKSKNGESSGGGRVSQVIKNKLGVNLDPDWFLDHKNTYGSTNYTFKYVYIAPFVISCLTVTLLWYTTDQLTGKNSSNGMLFGYYIVVTLASIIAILPNIFTFFIYYQIKDYLNYEFDNFSIANEMKYEFFISFGLLMWYLFYIFINATFASNTRAGSTNSSNSVSNLNSENEFKWNLLFIQCIIFCKITLFLCILFRSKWILNKIQVFLNDKRFRQHYSVVRSVKQKYSILPDTSITDNNNSNNNSNNNNNNNNNLSMMSSISKVNGKTNNDNSHLGSGLKKSTVDSTDSSVARMTAKSISQLESSTLPTNMNMNRNINGKKGNGKTKTKNGNNNYNYNKLSYDSGKKQKKANLQANIEMSVKLLLDDIKTTEDVSKSGTIDSRDGRISGDSSVRSSINFGTVTPKAKSPPTPKIVNEVSLTPGGPGDIDGSIDGDSNSSDHKQLSQIFSHSKALDLFVQHLGREWSVESALSLIEFVQFERYIYNFLENVNKVLNDKSKIALLMQMENDMISLQYNINLPISLPKSSIVYSNEDYFNNLLNIYCHENSKLDVFNLEVEWLNDIKYKAYLLYSKYVEFGSDFEINVSYRVRKELRKIMKKENFDNFNSSSRSLVLSDVELTAQELKVFRLFHRCCVQMFHVMIGSFQRFQQSKHFNKLQNLVLFQ